jgi:PhnB protein
MRFHPYLNFGGNCREAFTHYQEILGGELEILGMSDLPEGVEMPPGMGDLVMHAALTAGDGLLMASDAPPGEFHPAQGMYVNHTVADVDEAKRVFAALSEGGEVTMPFAETFWSPGFGICTDKFGTPWMVNTEAPEETS